MNEKGGHSVFQSNWDRHFELISQTQKVPLSKEINPVCLSKEVSDVMCVRCFQYDGDTKVYRDTPRPFKDVVGWVGVDHTSVKVEVGERYHVSEDFTLNRLTYWIERV